MKDNKKRRKKNRLVIIILPLIVYVAFIFWNQSQIEKELAEKKLEIQAEIHKLEIEISELNRIIEKSDSLDFVEKMAREELGMVKSREIIYIDKNNTNKSVFNVFKDHNNWQLQISNIYYLGEYI